MTEEKYRFALANAMHVEYQAIVDAGFLLQIDDPRLAAHYDRHPESSVEDCPSSSPYDFELQHFVDLMLDIRAAAYSFEASNPRHEHEWQVWETVRLPDDKVLIPGVVSHCITLVEHPVLVAHASPASAGVVGRLRVIASNDRGFATAFAGDEVHPDVAWAKLQALVEGTRPAAVRLW